LKTVGIIGGIAPESTIDYYRQIIARYRERKTDGTYPQIIINSIDLTKMLGFVATGDLAALTEHLLVEVHRLADADADFALFASNTPHIVFNEVAAQSPLKLISIVECTAGDVEEKGLKKVGLLGTRFTMRGGFYQKLFAARGIEVVVPDAPDQTYVHDRYMNELVHARFQNETRDGFLRVIDTMRQQAGIEGVILGGTELPLILRDVPDQGIPFFDTTKIHVQKVIAELFPGPSPRVQGEGAEGG
jgi:aspartate racemase